MIIFLIIFFCLQAFVLLCCLAAGNDPASQKISDQEQLEYIRMWMKNMVQDNPAPCLFSLYSTVTLFARFLGLSTSRPLATLT